MKPGFESEGFKTYQESLGNETLHTLIGKIKALNQTIVDDPDLGEGFQIGHSYLCGWQPGKCTDEAVQAVVEFEILPTLREYWFDDLKKCKNGNRNCVVCSMADDNSILIKNIFIMLQLRVPSAARREL